MKPILVCLLVAWLGEAGAQIVSRDSVHLKPVGSVVQGSFVLVNKVIPLPEGEFVLLAVQVRDAKFGSGDFARQEHRLVDVALGQMVDRRLRAGVVGTALLAERAGRFEWRDEPCKRDDTLFKLNSVPFMKRNYSQNCLLVNHSINSLSQSASGVYEKTAAWIKDQGGTTPIPTMLQASITRIELADFLQVHYGFNPDAYGCGGTTSSSWVTSAWHKSRIGKDAEKARFVEGIIEFGKAMQVRVNEAFEGRRQVAESLAAATPRVQRCGGS